MVARKVDRERESMAKKGGSQKLKDQNRWQLADSDEGGQLFRLKADSASDRLRTPFR
jgi:hypothetical protein